MDGILLVDKPRGKTSHDVVDEVRALAGQRDVGHAGTLDPLATGLLVLALGKALKTLEFMESHDKEYEVSVRFGVTTETDDAEGRIVAERPVGATREQVAAAAARFVGEIDQRPPAYSAIKVGGEPLHRKARRGEKVDPAPRRVRVDEFALREFAPPVARFLVRCGKGTYVRSLARDLGEALGCGAHVEELRRTASGPFRIGDAMPLAAPLDLLPLDVGLASMPEVRLGVSDAKRFENGGIVEMRPPSSLVRVYCGPRFLGVGAASDGKLRPRKVMI